MNFLVGLGSTRPSSRRFLRLSGPIPPHAYFLQQLICDAMLEPPLGKTRRCGSTLPSCHTTVLAPASASEIPSRSVAVARPSRIRRSSLYQYSSVMPDTNRSTDVRLTL